MNKNGVKYLKKNRQKNFLITEWAYKKGVFLTPQGKYIARVQTRGYFKSLSQHSTKKEAQKVYDDFYKNNKPTNLD